MPRCASGYNEAIDWIGGPEVITGRLLVRLGGEINGIMLSVRRWTLSIRCWAA